MNSSEKMIRLGKSDLRVSPIGLGCWQFSKKNNFAGRFWPFLEDDEIKSIVRTSLEGGINWFDTAELYGNGASERSLSRALRELGKQPGDVTIVTKWWPMFRMAGSLITTMDQRLAALDPFPVDLHLVHQPYGFSGVREEMEAMLKLIASKKIRYAGVSNFSAAQMRTAWETLDKAGAPLVVNEVRYSLLDRRIESNGILQTAQELGITLIAYSPLAQGLLTGKFHDHPERVKETGFRKYSLQFQKSALEKSRPVIDLVKQLGLKYNVTPTQIALNWLINHHGETVVAIPGATKESQAAQNTGALKFTLSEEDLALLDKRSERFK
ncbi:MAG TPA: aldo/keto reductase [Bacteroidales bacterium]|nr:aldo/keto reductase [Bacteroidales bacterium]